MPVPAPLTSVIKAYLFRTLLSMPVIPFWRPYSDQRILPIFCPALGRMSGQLSIHNFNPDSTRGLVESADVLVQPPESP